jgi:PAT family beta-lactamase induction signal transducer AmpG
MRTWIVHFLMGFSCGLPYLLTASTLQAWMTDQHVDLKAIGLFALVRIPYNFKFLWAPFVDKFSLPFMTHRRGWILVTQIFLALMILGLGFSDPMGSPVRTIIFAFLLTFAAASQDISIDAYRTESLDGKVLGMATSSYITGFRIGMLVSGAFALYIADQWGISWAQVYQVMAAFTVVGMIATMIAPEKKLEVKPRTMKEAVVEPFLDFFRRKHAWLLMFFIVFYKFGDNLASAMLTPFILQHGYTKTEYALVAKGVGFFSVLAGGFLGGPFMLRFGIYRSLWVFGVGQAITVLGFAGLASIDHSTTALSLVIMGENFFIGLGAAAFSAFVSNITNKTYSATQYALLTSLMALSATVLSAPSGWLAEKLGWTSYFIFCVVMTIPGFILLYKVGPYAEKEAHRKVVEAENASAN